jgi:hypothetical protein
MPVICCHEWWVGALKVMSGDDLAITKAIGDVGMDAGGDTKRRKELIKLLWI